MKVLAGRRTRRLAAGAAAFLLSAVAVAAASTPAAADDVRDRSWHLDAMNLSEVHAVTKGAGITVAVIDSGVDADHQDLAGNVLPGFDLTDPTNATRGHEDTTGHGTSVASLIAGHGHGPSGGDGVLGVAPEAKILPLDIADPDTGEALPGAISAAIRQAVDAGADVICVAFAGGREPDDASAIEYAAARGVVVVAGVGNEPAALVGDPAAIPLTLATTAYDQAGEPATTVRGTPERAVDIAAPGADIVVALPGNDYGLGRGTSAATAIVAGVLALVLSAHPQATRNEQVERIVFTADDIGADGPDNVFGWGAVNVVEAVTGTPRRPGESPTPTGIAADPALPTDDSGTSEAGSMADAGTIVAVAAAAVVLAAGAAVAIVLLRRRRGRAVR